MRPQLLNTIIGVGLVLRKAHVLCALTYFALRTRVCSAKDDSGKIGRSSSFDATIIRVTSDGAVLWCPNAFLMSHCPVDVARFPFDKQQCSVDFELWGHDSEFVKLKARTGDVDLTYYHENGEWDLIGALQYHVVFYVSAVN
jgi:hypothetical protein